MAATQQAVVEIEIPKNHEKKLEQAYNAGLEDGKLGNAFRYGKLMCVCRYCRETYTYGFESGEMERTSKDE